MNTSMKGQVFTIAKLHYINGVVYEVAKRGITDLQALAGLSAHTTKSGKVKHPLVRVRTLARFAEGLGLIEIINAGVSEIVVTDIRDRYDNMSEYLIEHSNLKIREFDI